ncbi:MAG: DUF1822 family protein [Nostocaceae cyanobacterium]|nr:DUF1822 family protein [Nostocaceae cyanobacterium]
MNTTVAIMNHEIESWTFTVPLALEAHKRADKLRRYQSNPQKAKQVYLNTLAVYAVNIYLQCQGFETDWDNNYSDNPMLHLLMDVADLPVKNRGTLDCRPVLANSTVMEIPPEVWQERIGYVAVQLNESLREATVLGFVNQVNKSQIPVSQLRSLAEFPGYLNQFRPLVRLSQWWENVFEAGWQAVESLINIEASEPAYRFRHRFRQSQIRRGKLIKLGTLNQAVALIVDMNQGSEEEVNINVEVQPSKGQSYLPPNLQLMILDEQGKTVIEACAGIDNRTIQLEFDAEPGDSFSVAVLLENVSVIEYFVI